MPLLTAQAHTFRQQARLAVTLSWVAGYVNVSVVAVCGTTVSHVTGNLTTFGLHLAEWFGRHGSVTTVLFLMHLPTGFLFGAMVSQALHRFAQRLHFRRPAALSMAVEVLLLTALAFSVERFEAEGHAVRWLWAVTSVGVVAMGLQNATITRISGSTVRTTHLTGVTTDFGIETVDSLIWLTHRLKSKAKQRVRRVARAFVQRRSTWRLAVFAAIFWSFLLGAVLGAIVFDRWPGVGVWPPAVFLLTMLLLDLWLIARRRSAISAKRRKLRP